MLCGRFAWALTWAQLMASHQTDVSVSVSASMRSSCVSVCAYSRSDTDGNITLTSMSVRVAANPALLLTHCDTANHDGRHRHWNRQDHLVGERDTPLGLWGVWAVWAPATLAISRALLWPSVHVTNEPGSPTALPTFPCQISRSTPFQEGLPQHP